MTNYEHYKEQIEKIARLGWRVAVDNNNKPHACVGTWRYKNERYV